MGKRGKRGFRITAGLTAMLLGVTGALEYGAFQVRAVLDEASAVRFDTFSQQNIIEDGTLFIGTYLIQMEAMTDELYAKAQESAEDSGQYDVYYKSELADGTWYDISSASGLSDITKGAAEADAGTMAQLWVTFYAGKDGIVRNAQNHSAVSIFDTPSPYDLYGLSELEALRMQYDNTYTSESTGVSRYFHNRLRDFFALDLRNAVTDECDRQLAVLQQVYESLQAQDKAEQAESVYALMGKIDAKRRAEVFYQLMEAENSRLDQLQMQLGGSGYNKGDYDDEQFTESAQLSDAVGTAMESCESSYITHSGNQLANDGTVLGEAEYTQSMAILQKAESGNSQLDTELAELENISNIRNSRIKDKDAELALLDGKLIPEAKARFEAAVSSGAGQEYNAAVSQGKSKALCEEFLDAQKEAQDKCQSEYQFLIKARTERMGSGDAADYLFDKIEEAGSLYDSIPQDAYEKKAQAGVDDGLLWLQELAQSVIDGDSSLKSTLDKLESDKDSIRTQRDAALDENNLGLAKKYDAMLEAIDVEIAAEESRLTKELAEGSVLDRAKALTQLGAKTEAANIMKLKNKALQGLTQGDTNGIAEAAAALGALGAQDALAELLAKTPDDAAAGVRQALDAALETANSMNAANGGGTAGGGTSGAGSTGGGTAGGGTTGGGTTGGGTAGDGTTGGGTTGGGSTGGSGTTGAGSLAMTADELLAQLEAATGAAFEDMSEQEQAAAVGALSALGTSGSVGASQLAGTLADQCLQAGNPYVFVRYAGAGSADGKYVSAGVISAVTKFRYIYSSSKKDAALSNRGKTYHFTVGSTQLVHPDASVQEMQYETVLQSGTAYIPAAVAEEYFGCRTEYIDGTEYAVCITSAMESRVGQMTDELGGGTE